MFSILGTALELADAQKNPPSSPRSFSEILNTESLLMRFFVGYKLGRVVLGMLGKFSITLSFNAFYIWSAELHATVVR